MTPDALRRVYVAHPKATYGSAWEMTCLAAIAKAFPDAELMNPADLFESNQHWRHKNLIVLSEADLIVVFGDEKGWIGLGTFSEIGTAAAMGKPVLYLDPESDVLRDRAIIREPVRRGFPRTPQAIVRMFRMFARVTPIPPVDLEAGDEE